MLPEPELNGLVLEELVLALVLKLELELLPDWMDEGEVFVVVVSLEIDVEDAPVCDVLVLDGREDVLPVCADLVVEVVLLDEVVVVFVDDLDAMQDAGTGAPPRQLQALDI